MRRLAVACWLIPSLLVGLVGVGCDHRPVQSAPATATAEATPASVLPPASTPTGVAPTASPTATLMAPARATVSILYDNVPWREGMQTAWGYACLVRIGETSILFDTGGDGALLFANMAALGVEPEAVDVVVLSHAHADHTGGLAELLASGVRPIVYIPASFPEALKRQIAGQGHLVEINGPVEVAPGVYSTGQVGSQIVEQALVVVTAEGAVVITGCAHPGVVAMVRAAQQAVGDEIALVMGGFHLEDATQAEIEDTIKGLRALGVQRVAPSHCTGELAQRMFAEEFGEACLGAGAGWEILLELPSGD